MANTEYYKGKTIDPDEGGKFLKIEGEKYNYKPYGDRYVYKHNRKYVSTKKKFYANGLIALGRLIINDHPKTKILEKERKKHIRKLEEGKTKWNRWRDKEPQIRPILYDLGRNKKECAKIDFKKLKGINFSNANLINADLSFANLTNANFHEANLGGAKLEKAILVKANFCRTDFYKSDLSGANLTKANLQGAQIAGTKLGKTIFKDCKVYGSSAWDIDLRDTIQKSLEVVYKKEGDNGYTELKVNDLGMAQFLYFILNNKNLFNVFKSTSSSLVLLLGRFQKEDKMVLDKLRKNIQANTSNKYVPVLFDFEKPESYDYTGVITVMAGMSKFIIADLTNAKSVPHELHAIVGAFPTPIIPIIRSFGKSKAKPFSMFVDYYKYYWVHPVIKYPLSGISSKNCDKLISVAEKFYKEIKTIREKREIESIPMANL